MNPRGAEMPAFPDHMAVTEAPDAEHPFRLVTAPAHNYLNSSFTEDAHQHSQGGQALRPVPPRRRPRPRLRGRRPRAHRQPAGLDPASRAHRERQRHGRANGTTHGQQRGTVIVESIWPNTAFEEGLGINTADLGRPRLSQRWCGVPRHPPSGRGPAN